METKECGFSGFKMNGFLALFLHLVVLTAVIIFGFIISVPTLILSVCLCLVWFIMFAGYMELEPMRERRRKILLKSFLNLSVIASVNFC